MDFKADAHHCPFGQVLGAILVAWLVNGVEWLERSPYVDKEYACASKTARNDFSTIHCPGKGAWLLVVAAVDDGHGVGDGVWLVFDGHL